MTYHEEKKLRYILNQPNKKSQIKTFKTYCKEYRQDVISSYPSVTNEEIDKYYSDKHLWGDYYNYVHNEIWNNDQIVDYVWGKQFLELLKNNSTRLSWMNYVQKHRPNALNTVTFIKLRDALGL